jgi:hypothetical protein
MLLTKRCTRYSGCGAVFEGGDSPGAIAPIELIRGAGDRN